MSNFNYTTGEIEMSTLNEDQRGNLISQTNANHFSLPIIVTSDENGFKKTENTQKKWEKNSISKCDNMWMPQENSSNSYHAQASLKKNDSYYIFAKC